MLQAAITFLLMSIIATDHTDGPTTSIPQDSKVLELVTLRSDGHGWVVFTVERSNSGQSLNRYCHPLNGSVQHDRLDSNSPFSLDAHCLRLPERRCGLCGRLDRRRRLQPSQPLLAVLQLWSSRPAISTRRRPSAPIGWPRFEGRTIDRTQCSTTPSGWPAGYNLVYPAQAEEPNRVVYRPAISVGAGDAVRNVFLGAFEPNVLQLNWTVAGEPGFEGFSASYETLNGQRLISASTTAFLSGSTESYDHLMSYFTYTRRSPSTQDPSSAGGVGRLGQDSIDRSPGRPTAPTLAREPSSVSTSVRGFRPTLIAGAASEFGLFLLGLETDRFHKTLALERDFVASANQSSEQIEIHDLSSEQPQVTTPQRRSSNLVAGTTALGRHQQSSTLVASFPGTGPIARVETTERFPGTHHIAYVTPDNEIAVAEVVLPCREDEHTLCLGNGRFKVQAAYLTHKREFGMANLQALTADTGYATFFDPDNIELIVKVLDACFLGSYWVFAAGLTDVAVEIMVTDTMTGDSRVYASRYGPFALVRDLGSFLGCGASTATAAPDALLAATTSESIAALLEPTGAGADVIVPAVVAGTAHHHFRQHFAVLVELGSSVSGQPPLRRRRHLARPERSGQLGLVGRRHRRLRLLLVLRSRQRRDRRQGARRLRRQRRALGVRRRSHRRRGRDRRARYPDRP